MFNFLKKASSSKQKEREALLERSCLLRDSYRAMTDYDLRNEFRKYCELFSSQKLTAQECLPELCALCEEAYWRVLGNSFFSVQIVATGALCDGKVAEISYFDNKNAVIIITALILASSGKKVWILSSNANEVMTNSAWYGRLAQFFGIPVGTALDTGSPEERAEAYDAAIIYAEATVFGSDYVHFLADPSYSGGMKDLDAAIIDGAESVLIENADILCRYQEKGALSEKYLSGIIKDFRFCCGVTHSVAGHESIYKDVYGLETEQIPPMRPPVNLALSDKVFLTGAERSAKLAAYVKKRVTTPDENGKYPSIVVNTSNAAHYEQMIQLLRKEGIAPALYTPYMPLPAQTETIRGMTAPAAVTVALELDKNRIEPGQETDSFSELEMLSVGHLFTRNRDQVLLGQVVNFPGTSCFYCACDEYPSDDRSRVFAESLKKLSGGTLDAKMEMQWRSICEKAQISQEGLIKANVLRTARGIRQQTVEEAKSIYGWDAPSSGVVANSQFPAYLGSEPFIFISYAHKDSEAVGRLIEELQKRGYRVWWDLSIPFGSEWEKELFTKIEGCETMLAFISEGYLANKYTNIEINYASESLSPSKPCLLALIEDVDLPDRYKRKFGKTQYAERKRFTSVQQFIDYISTSPQLNRCKN